MAPRMKLVLGSVPCLLTFASVAFAQGTTTNATTTTAPAPAPAAPAAPATPADTTAATTTTTTTTAPAATGVDQAPLPHTGGDPAMFVLLGGALSGSALAMRRRFGR